MGTALEVSPFPTSVAFEFASGTPMLVLKNSCCALFFCSTAADSTILLLVPPLTLCNLMLASDNVPDGATLIVDDLFEGGSTATAESVDSNTAEAAASGAVLRLLTRTDEAEDEEPTDVVFLGVAGEDNNCVADATSTTEHKIPKG